MMLPPMPFIDVVTTGCEEAEYMTAGHSRRGWDGGGDRQTVPRNDRAGAPKRAKQVVGRSPSSGALPA